MLLAPPLSRAADGGTDEKMQISPFSIFCTFTHNPPLRRGHGHPFQLWQAPFLSFRPAPCSGAKRLLSSALACLGPWLNLFPPERCLGPDGLMGDLPGEWSRGTWGQSCTLLGGKCHLSPLLGPLVARALRLALRCMFNFSYPLSKHFGFLPKYLGKIVYLWLLSPPMTQCNLAAAASPAPFIGGKGVPQRLREKPLVWVDGTWG